MPTGVTRRSGPISSDHHAQKRRLYEHQTGRCYACAERKKYNELTRHHVILHACGGSDDDENICLLCERCHWKCHCPFDGVRHDVLRPIFIAFGFGPRVRSELYQMYRRYGVFGPRLRKVRSVASREYSEAMERWEGEGGSVYHRP